MCSDAVCLVIGAGAGVGQAVVARFARAGFHACAVRRGSGSGRLSPTDGGSDAAALEAFCSGLQRQGLRASAHFADATDAAAMGALVERVEREIGPINVAVYNVGAQIGNRSLERTSHRAFELAFKLGSFGAFVLAKAVAPHMLRRGEGTLLFTSATAAHRGNAGQLAHTAAMSGRRHLAQSLAAELGPRGVHVATVNLDGMVYSPETLGRLMPDAFDAAVAKLRPTQSMIEPAAVAETYLALHLQPRCAWSFETDLRPWTEKHWYHSSPSRL